MNKKLFYILIIFVSFFLGFLSYKFFFIESKPIIIEESEYTSVSVCDEVLSKSDRKVKVFEGTPAPVNFKSMPEAKLFRTTINEQSLSGPNFAGHYTVADWGCGTECQGYAIIDSITGNIVDYKPYLEHQVSDGLDYELNSNVITLNPKSSNQKYLDSIKGKSVQEMVNDDFEAHKARIFYQLIENNDKAYLRKLCVENILDGQF